MAKKKNFGEVFNSYIQMILNIAALIIALIALKFSFSESNKSNIQFIESSKKSDSLFNLQLQTSKNNNDSIVSQFNNLQKINKNQLKINEKLLAITNKTLQAQLYAGRPVLVIDRVDLVNNKPENNIYSPKIKMQTLNIGNRFAHKVKQCSFIISKDYSYCSYKNTDLKDDTYEPKLSRILEFVPNIDYQNFDKNDFYLCVLFKYNDPILNKDFNQEYYFNYHLNVDSYQFYICEEPETNRLKNLVKAIIKKEKLNYKI